MAKREPREEEAAPIAPGLARLPPGRHGLPREFVTENQRGRLIAGIISVVAEHGYHDATITQIAAAAGVSRRTFYTYFASKQDCFFEAYERIGDHLREAATEASAPYEDWADRVAARIRCTLEQVSANPDLVRFYLIAPPRAGDEIADRYRNAAIRALADVTAGKPPPTARKPSEAVEYAVMGGVAALVADKVESGEGDRLTELLPDLVELVLTPYLGREEAVRVSRRTA